GLTRRRPEKLHANPPAAPFVAKEVAPATRLFFPAGSVSSQSDGTRAADDNAARLASQGAFERAHGVVSKVEGRGASEGFEHLLGYGLHQRAGAGHTHADSRDVGRSNARGLQSSSDRVRKRSPAALRPARFVDMVSRPSRGRADNLSFRIRNER